MSGPPDAPMIAKPGALALSQTFLVPSIEVVLSKPNNTGCPFFSSLHFNLVDSPCALLLMAYALLVSARWCFFLLNIDVVLVLPSLLLMAYPLLVSP